AVVSASAAVLSMALWSAAATPPTRSPPPPAMASRTAGIRRGPAGTGTVAPTIALIGRPVITVPAAGRSSTPTAHERPRNVRVDSPRCGPYRAAIAGSTTTLVPGYSSTGWLAVSSGARSHRGIHTCRASGATSSGTGRRCILTRGSGRTAPLLRGSPGFVAVGVRDAAPLLGRASL